MTEENPRTRGAEKLYEKDVTLRNSPAFSVIMSGVGKILGWFGIGIDRGLDALGIGKYFARPENEEQAGYKTSYQKVPAVAPTMASGYKMALAGQIPMSMYRSHKFNSGYRTGRCAA